MGLVACGVWLEAIRRKEIYVIVAVSCLFILGLSQLRFFGLVDLSKFYREVALKIMGTATALTVIVLGSRQLPREFDSRTIYPLLARPIHRITYLFGKQLGVMSAGAFCLGLFLILYVLGCLLLGKWLACVAGGLLVYALFVIIVEVVTPRLEPYVFAT